LRNRIDEQDTIVFSQRSSSLKVVVADDSALVRERLTGTLVGISGVTVVGSARCADEAVNTFNSTPADLFILDIQMPGGSGIDVLREIKLRRSSAVVIIFTNHFDLHYRQKCIEFGADHFLSKASDLEQLIRIVEELATSQTTGEWDSKLT